MINSNAKNVKLIQLAIDELVASEPVGYDDPLNHLAFCILERFDASADKRFATDRLLSPELPAEAQKFAAAWLTSVSIRSPEALANVVPRVANLFDRAYPEDLYKHLGIERGARTQTFDKISKLNEHAKGVVEKADKLIDDPFSLNVNRVGRLERDIQELLNNKYNRPILAPLLPSALIRRERIAALFQNVKNYLNDEGADVVDRRDLVVSECDSYENEAVEFGSREANRILGGIARKLREETESQFKSLAVRHPNLKFIPVNKKYPLERIGARFAFKIRVENRGSGPAIELRLDNVETNDSLELETSGMSLGTLQPSDDFVVEVIVRVKFSPSNAGESILANFSWRDYSTKERSEHEDIFDVKPQKPDVDWIKVELEEPYSLDAIVSGKDLIGRRKEMIGLLKRAKASSVGSSYIFGQKRVGKTSLANAIIEELENSSDEEWIIIQKGSGDYVAGDAPGTLSLLGDVLVKAIQDRVPSALAIPSPDFSNGLAPLSAFIDSVIANSPFKFLFVLDEFDELPVELLRRTDVSASLFQPMRQISRKLNCGFLLIGGENIHQLMNTQGDRLNNFQSTRVDYFDRSNDWSDFVELIRRPVKHWLTLNDDALNELFRYSAGNPYFAKLLASQLASDMVENRYSDANEFDMSDSIEKALASAIGPNSFAHFWMDGILRDDETAEKQRMERRLALVAMGRALRNGEAANYESVRDECGSLGLTMTPTELKDALEDFVRRGVLVANESEEYRLKIPLFKSWLIDKGVGELLPDIREREHVSRTLEKEEEERIKDHEVSELAGKLGYYQGRRVEPSNVRQWLDQFGPHGDQRLMYRLLSEVQMYDQPKIRTKMKEAFGIVREELTTIIERRSRRDILVSCVDETPAKSGLTYCRLFAQENQIWKDSVMTIDQMKQMIKDRPAEIKNVQRLVLVDDFSGTGGTIIDGLRRELDVLKSLNRNGVRIIVIALAGFDSAQGKIQSFIEQSELDAKVYFCDPFGDEHRAFSETSRAFLNPAERERAREIAEDKGVQLDNKQPLGYGNTQSLVVFSDSCPNNTLPILWADKKGWTPIFPRR